MKELGTCIRVQACLDRVLLLPLGNGRLLRLCLEIEGRECSYFLLISYSVVTRRESPVDLLSLSINLLAGARAGVAFSGSPFPTSKPSSITMPPRSKTSTPPESGGVFNFPSAVAIRGSTGTEDRPSADTKRRELLDTKRRELLDILQKNPRAHEDPEAREKFSAMLAEYTKLAQPIDQKDVIFQIGQQLFGMKKYKIVLVGEPGSCSAFVKKHTTGHLVSAYESTTGAEVSHLVFHTSAQRAVMFEIWDTAGREKLGALRDGYYVGADGAIFMYDLTSKGEYHNPKGWRSWKMPSLPGPNPSLVSSLL